MISKTMRVMSLTIAMLLIFSSCSSFNKNSAAGANLTKKFSFISSQDDETFNYQTLMKASNSFGMDIFRNTAAEDTGKNVIISPLSMFTAFSVLMNGAGGETKSQMKSVMHIDNYDDVNLNTGINKLINYMNGSKTNENNGLKKVYNSVWIDKSFDVKNSFIKTAKEYYDSDIFKQDFDSKRTVDKMNGWISDKSGGLIKNAIDQIKPYTRVTIFNVLHFKGKWNDEFDKSKTQSEDFRLQNGECIKVNMMNDERKMSYYEDENVQVGCLSFDNRAEMLIMLPKGDIDMFAANLNGDSVNKYADNSNIAKVKLKMPSFNVEYKRFLESNMQVMGMKLPFDAKNADFSGIKNNNDPLWVSDVLHDCVVKVDEKGTEAAALTAIMGTSSTPPKEMQNKELYIDRPFLFAIKDYFSGSILFIGKIVDPRK